MHHGHEIYVCNIATQTGKRLTSTSTTRHGAGAARWRPVSSCPGQRSPNANAGENQHLEPVPLPQKQPVTYTLLTADVIDEKRPWRHNSVKLAKVIMDIHAEPAL